MVKQITFSFYSSIKDIGNYIVAGGGIENKTNIGKVARFCEITGLEVKMI